MSSGRLVRTPIAIGSDGALIVNALAFTHREDVHEAIEAAMARGDTVFIGVTLTARQAREALRQLDDAAAEIAGRVQPVRRA